MAVQDTYTSTPVEWRELCQFTGRNSTRPICCCSWAFLKCACSMLRETFLKSFTGKEHELLQRSTGLQGKPAASTTLNKIKEKIITRGNPTRVFNLLLLP